MMTSEPTSSINIGDNAKNVTIINNGNDNQIETSYKQHPGETHSAEAAASEQSSKAFSADDRRRLRQTLNALPLSLFEDLVYDLAVPEGVFSSVKASQPERCRALLSWAESSAGIGLAKVEESLIPIMAEQGRSFLKYLECLLEGEFSQQTISELQPFIQRLRQITGDDSIDINFVAKGSIKMILSGSSDGLKKLKNLYESGELEGLDLPSVENVQFIENDTTTSRKARLIDALKLNGVNLLYTRARALAINLSLSLDRARALDSESARVLAVVLARASDLALALSITFALALDPDRDLASDLASDLGIASDLVRDLASARAYDLDLDSARARARNLESDLARARNLARDSDSNSDLALDLALDLDSDSDSARALARALDLDLDLNLDLDLTKADLKGANLSNLYLVGADLTGADLTEADVQGTVFGDNEGLSELTKRDLEMRGAIFQDSPGSYVPRLVRV